MKNNKQLDLNGLQKILAKDVKDKYNELKDYVIITDLGKEELVEALGATKAKRQENYELYLQLYSQISEIEYIQEKMGWI